MDVSKDVCVKQKKVSYQQFSETLLKSGNKIFLITLIDCETRIKRIT